MATRKFYASEEYKQKRRELENILFGQVARLTLSSEEYNIQGEASEQQEFISASEMPLFAQLADFDCRTIKLVNYGRPAIKLTYFTKHKYTVQKKVHPDQASAIVSDHIKGFRASYNAEDVSSETKAILSAYFQKSNFSRKLKGEF